MNTELIDTRTRQSGSITWTTRITRVTFRETARCRTCKAARSRLQVVNKERTSRSDMMGDRGTSKPTVKGRFECCSKSWAFAPVKGTYSPDKTCGARCLNAIGHDCDCSCAGVNHGANHHG